jgi:NADH dehydrogenase (ubiquinone) 1 alpha subcomplex subunit 13
LSGDLLVGCAGCGRIGAGTRAKLTYVSELAREKMWARIHLIPALQAEEDRDQVRRYLADKAREKELLGTETRVYHSDRCVLVPLAILRGFLTH